MSKFNELEISNDILRGISDMGFEEMSPIQKEAIPFILKGEDIIGQAQTGTGKTAAFGIPILENIDCSLRQVQALVLCPTRELSMQVAKEINNLGKYKKNLQVLPIYGGQPINRQIKSLQRGVQVVVGTPGRVMDHMRRKTLKLDNINMIILDEADEMFDMGFRDDMAFVMDRLRDDRQTIFFSATMAKEIVNFAKRYQKNPRTVKVVQKKLTVPRVEQVYFELKPHMKTETLTRLIDIHNPELTVVFSNTKKQVDKLVDDLTSKGYFADGLHGDLRQGQRDNVMNKFRKGSIDILVATDVAARGIDVDEVDMVVNYDLPQDVEYYVHRIGRTARAGREGKAFSFVTRRDFNRLRDIQRYTKTKIKSEAVPTLKDIKNNKIMDVVDNLKEELSGEGLGKYRELVESLTTKEYTSLDVAAAVLKLHIEESLDKKEGKKPVDEGISGRLYINVGHKMGVSPAHILSAVLDSTRIGKEEVGKIDIFDTFSFVEVPESKSREVINGLNGERINGRRVRVEASNPR